VRAEEENAASPYVLSVIDSLKKRITADRLTYIKVPSSYICLFSEYLHLIFMLLIFLML
jgi:hypothetical protein